MPRCPNCGQETARTEDWACQWCGYPLLSKAYKKVPKTYRQLKEDKHTASEPELISKPQPALKPPIIRPQPEPKLELISKPQPAPEPLIIQPQSEPKPELISRPQPAPDPPIVQLQSEPRPELISRPQPAPEPLIIQPALEITVDELLAAYEAEGAGADAKFANKILKITGVVNRIQAKEAFGTHYITLTGAVKKLLLQEVRCFFDSRPSPELNMLTPGQKVTVQGKYDGSMINIRMRDCTLIH